MLNVFLKESRGQDVDIYENIARIRPSSSSFGFATPNYVPASAFLDEADTAYGHHMITVNLIRKPNGFGFRVVGGTEVHYLRKKKSIGWGGARYRLPFTAYESRGRRH